MNYPEEQKRVDVTTEPRPFDGRQRPPPRPPKPRRPRRSPRAVLGEARRRAAERLGAVLSAVLRGLSRPIVPLAALALALALAHARSRPAPVDGPALPTAGWRASASPPLGAGAALDGDRRTRWVGRRVQAPWFAVDMGRRQTFHQVVMDAGTYADDYPRNYAVYVSDDGVHWRRPVASGAGSGAVTVANFGRTAARWIKVVEVLPDGHGKWSLCEFSVH